MTDVCAICARPRDNRESDPHGVFGYHDFTPREEAVPAPVEPTPQEKMRDAATRAAVWGVIAAAAKDRQDEAKAELRQLEPGDTIAGKVNGQLVGKATMTNGRAKLVVTDEQKLLDWLTHNHPTEVMYSVNPAYLKHIEERAKTLGEPVDANGDLVPGVELREGTPYVTVRKEKDAPFIVAQLLGSGRVQLDGIKEIEAAQ